MNEYVVLFFGSAGILGFLGSMIAIRANKDKSAAETRKLIAETEDIRIKAQGELQDQLFELIEQNQKQYAEREKERDAKRTELNLLSKRIEILGEMLSNEQSRAIQLLSENAEKDKIIKKLESNFIALNADMTKIKRVTGQLGNNGT